VSREGRLFGDPHPAALALEMKEVMTAMDSTTMHALRDRAPPAHPEPQVSAESLAQLPLRQGPGSGDLQRDAAPVAWAQELLRGESRKVMRNGSTGSW